MSLVKKILASDLCIGCGLCEAVSSDKSCVMQINEKGFYVPTFLGSTDTEVSQKIAQICPGINVTGNGSADVWGPIQTLTEAWAIDDRLRKKGSSGGTISALATYLLRESKVDAVLQVGVKDGEYLYNQLKVSKTEQDVYSNAASRYAPALVFHKILDVFNASKDVYAFVGKPCDIACMQNLLKAYPQYQGRVKYYIALFCAGMPSYEGTQEVIKTFHKQSEPVALKYRGDGWPGNFEAKFADGSISTMSYNDSWGKILGKYLGFRCKICPDGIGLLADISVGDSWNTKDGYPDFTEADGKSFMMVRTTAGLDLMNGAIEMGYLHTNSLDKSRVSQLQPYQYKRRLLVGYRILPVQIFTGFLLRFNGLGLLRLMLKAKLSEGLRNMVGTARRFMKGN